MIQKLLADGAGYIFILVGIVATITVGVMSILLPFIVFRIMSNVSDINKKLNKITALLGEEVRGGRETSALRHSPGAKLGPEPSTRGGLSGPSDKSLRFH